MYSLYTILGIEEGASEESVRSAYDELRQRLKPATHTDGATASLQAQQCLRAIEEAFETLTDPARRAAYETDWKQFLKVDAQGEIQPKLGQLCVAAGMISLDELEEAVESQTSLNLPLGQVLQEHKLISQAELDGLLIGQQLIRVPADSPHSVGQRMIALGLVTEDMVRIALIEERTFGKGIEDILIGHGWLEKDVVAALLKPVEQ